MTLKNVRLMDLIEDPENLRVTYDDQHVDELAESIRGVGLLNPLTVRVADDKFMVVAGHRRLRALHKVHDDRSVEVPCVVMDLSDEQVTAMMLVENLQRVDLDPIEEAKGYLRLTTVHGFKVDKLASTVGRRKQHIMDRIALLSLPDDVQACVGNTLSLEMALKLTKIEDPKKLKELSKDATKNRLQSWSVDNQLRTEDRNRQSALLTTGITERMLDVRGSLDEWDVKWADVEMDRDRCFDASTVKKYVAQPDDILVRRLVTVDVYRRLSEAELAERDRAEAAGVEVGEEITPWHEWRMRQDDWKDQVREWKEARWYAIGAVVVEMPAAVRQKVVLELVDWCATQVNENYSSWARARKVAQQLRLNGVKEDGTPIPSNELLASYMTQTGHPQIVWIIGLYCSDGPRPVSATFDQLYEEHLVADGLSVQPAFDEIEPWQDEAGVWVLDRPKELSVEPDEFLEEAYEDRTHLEDDDDYYDEDYWDGEE